MEPQLESRLAAAWDWLDRLLGGVWLAQASLERPWLEQKCLGGKALSVPVSSERDSSARRSSEQKWGTLVALVALAASVLVSLETVLEERLAELALLDQGLVATLDLALVLLGASVLPPSA